MKSIFQIFHRGLQKTATAISRGISGIFSSGQSTWDNESYDRLEAALISADFGAAASLKLVSDIKDRYERGQIKTDSEILKVAREDVLAILNKTPRRFELRDDGAPTVILLVGVNGCGKTTSAGKLAWMLKGDGKKTMLAACDTFRAAAVEQLKLWADKTACLIVSAKHGADPSSVAYDAVASAMAKKCDALIIDTAGRQHTKKGLMDELDKMRRTISKLMPGAPHEVWLVVDGSMGSNALVQTREFSRIGGVSGLILTKLDGTGKGGIVVAIKEELDIPVMFVGLGEAPDDLQPFSPEMFADALFEAVKN